MSDEAGGYDAMRMTAVESKTSFVDAEDDELLDDDDDLDGIPASSTLQGVHEPTGPASSSGIHIAPTHDPDDDASVEFKDALAERTT